jgi:hypothetical protein
MMRVYYAHCIAIYSTPQEDRDVFTLESMGFEVINPNSPDISARCQHIKAVHRALKDLDSGTSVALSENAVGRLQSLKTPRAEEEAIAQYADSGEAIMRLIFDPLVSPAKVDAVAFRALPDGRIPAGVMLEVELALSRGLPVFELPSNMASRGMSVEATRGYLREIGCR